MEMVYKKNIRKQVNMKARRGSVKKRIAFSDRKKKKNEKKNDK